MKIEILLQILFPLATIIGAIIIAAVNARNNHTANKTNLRITKENHEANLRLTQKAHEEKKKQVKREKLEQLMRAVYALKDWVLAYQSIWLFRYDAKEIEKLGESPLAKIQTLNTLYFSELEDSVAALSYRHYKYTAEIFEIAKPYLSNSKSPTDKEKETLKKHYRELRALSRAVEKECKTVMAKLDKW